MGEYKIHEQDKFLEKNRKMFNKGGVDKEALKAKKTSMNKVLEGVAQFPDKLHIVGPVGKESARKTKKEENPLHGGEGHEFSEK